MLESYKKQKRVTTLERNTYQEFTIDYLVNYIILEQLLKGKTQMRLSGTIDRKHQPEEVSGQKFTYQ